MSVADATDIVSAIGLLWGTAWCVQQIRSAIKKM